MGDTEAMNMSSGDLSSAEPEPMQTDESTINQSEDEKKLITTIKRELPDHDSVEAVGHDVNGKIKTENDNSNCSQTEEDENANDDADDNANNDDDDDDDDEDNANDVDDNAYDEDKNTNDDETTNVDDDENDNADDDDIAADDNDDDDDDDDDGIGDGDAANNAEDDDNVNDDEIFNFNLEPEVSKRPTRQLKPKPVEEPTPIDASAVHRIDYDCAVIFVCPACGYEMDSHEKWKRHIDHVHKYATRRGLNFVQVDKLYHQCLECKRYIAMHSMENLLKHKFTHLPYKRAKCKICHKQYKYRQDIMVHLRMSHGDELLNIAKSIKEGLEAQQKQHNQAIRHHHQPINFEIKNIQENAIDIFENTNDGVEVKSEAIHDDDDDDEELDELPTSSGGGGPQGVAIYDESLSRSSSHQSDSSLLQRPTTLSNKEELCEKLYIQYICPQCGAEFGSQPQWREHIDLMHNFGTRAGLNFKEINNKQQAKCLECDKVIFVNSIRNLQLHKFSHLNYKSGLRCKLCFRTFVGHKEIVKHLMTQHRLGDEGGGENNSDSQDARYDLDDDADNGNNDSQQSADGREEKIDHFEQHIDYLCPQCGKEFYEKRHWRKHIVKAHHLTDMKVLNFKVINERQVICLECSKVITNAYGVQNAQQHHFTHLPYKSFVRCRLCSKSYTDRKGLVKHLRSRHRLGDVPTSASPLTSNFSSSARQSQSQPQPVMKEIVKHADFTFEIKYLDDDNEGIDDNDNDNENDNDDTLDDDTPVPELNFSSSFSQQYSGVSGGGGAAFKCKQCSLSFTSQFELQMHVYDEHKFLDFNNLRPLPEGTRNYQRSPAVSKDVSMSSNKMHNYTPQKHSYERDDDSYELKTSSRRDDSFFNNSDSNNELLVPTGDEDNISLEAASIERNFCYLCPNCGIETPTQMAWRRHINDVHNYDKRHALNFRQLDKFRYQCLQCLDVVSGAKLKGLQDHKFRHLAYKLYIKCLLCGTCYNHKPNMMSHLRQRHNIIDTRTSIESPYEPNVFGGKTAGGGTPSSAPTTPQPKFIPKNIADDSLSYHNAVDHESITYFCPMCNENFSTHVYWRKHIVDKHNLNSKQGLNFRQIDEHHFLCLQCYKRVTVTHTKGAIGQLQSHKFRHLPYRSFKCNNCNGLFVRKQMFFKHLNKETNLCDSKMCEDDGEQETTSSTPTTQRPAAASKTQTQPKSQSSLSGNDANNTFSSLGDNFHNCFLLICPECGVQFESQPEWREHINYTHNFNKRETLNFKRLNSNLHECQECFEHVNGNKLRDLQIHKFKHLAYGAYIKCKYCSSAYSHMRNIHDHLKLKHREMLEKNNEANDDITFPEEETERVVVEPDEPFVLD